MAWNLLHYRKRREHHTSLLQGQHRCKYLYNALQEINSLSRFNEIKVSSLKNRATRLWYTINTKDIRIRTSSKTKDIAINRQLELLNASIRSLNLEIEQPILRFNKDMTCRRKDTDKRKKRTS